jgi:Kdo2-lipid IVA lauroyltransferase/acyltransferase
MNLSLREYVKHFHPKYWLTWLGLGFLYLVNRLPYPQQLAVGRGIGWVGFYCLRRFRYVARINLARCFPHLSNIQREQLLKKQFASLGMGVVESTMAWWTPIEKLRPLLHIEGQEHLEKALAKKQGVLLLSAHFSSLELCGRLFSEVFPIHVVYREQTNLVFNSLLKGKRNIKQIHSIPRSGIRSIIRTLQNKGIVWYAYDQDYGPRHSVFAPFFGIEAATITTPQRYIELTCAQTLTAFYRRLPEGKGYQITLRPVSEHFTQLNEREAATHLNQALEKAINLAPEQYFWIHRRFKTRPDAQTDFYTGSSK